MADIEIDLPIKIHIDFVEYSEHCPSLNTQFTFSVNYKNESLIDISYLDWIECFVWDEFLVNMYKITRGDKLTASLHGFTNKPLIKVIGNEDGISLIAYFTKSILFPNEINIQSSINVKLAPHELPNVYDKLNAFPKWW